MGGDYDGMGCGTWREALSARLDGEESVGAPAGSTARAERAALDAHLAGCDECRRWYEDAALITRIARIGLALGAQPVPDGVLSGAPTTTRATVARWLRIALALVGCVQALVGVAQIAGAAGPMGDQSIDGATPSHMMHEAAAWNLAIGAAYLFIAWRRTRPAAVIPMLTAFVGVLAIFSLDDVINGAVDAGRLASHGPVILGYVVVVIMSRPSMSFDGPAGSRRRGSRSRWRLDQWRLDDDAPDAPATLPRSGRRDTPAASAGDRAAA